MNLKIIAEELDRLNFLYFKSVPKENGRIKLFAYTKIQSNKISSLTKSFLENEIKIKEKNNFFRCTHKKTIKLIEKINTFIKNEKNFYMINLISELNYIKENISFRNRQDEYSKLYEKYLNREKKRAIKTKRGFLKIQRF